MVARLILIGLGLAAAVAASSAQAPSSDLDDLMSRVLTRRDDNWKKLQQYTLNERETMNVTALTGARVFGFDREYLWFPREGFFIRSPIRVDGVAIGEEERFREEQRWLERQRSRARRVAAREEPEAQAPDDLASGGSVGDVVNQAFEPQFIRSANFLRFKFDPGHYALAGRERLMNRDVLRIEYYPTKMFSEGRTRPNRQLREEDRRVGEKMNKVALVTLWVEPTENQILQYEFHNIDMDFLPVRSLLRIDQLRASMKMSEPFPNVWLPESIALEFSATLAIGEVSARYAVKYHDYRLATVTTRVR